jgi:hypothetical protein
MGLVRLSIWVEFERARQDRRAQAGAVPGDVDCQPAPQEHGLADLATFKPPGLRRQLRIDGEDSNDLTSRAGQRSGWSPGVFDVNGERQPGRTNDSGELAADRRLIAVVLMDRSWDSWACFRSDVAASLPVIHETVANRFGLEVASLDGKSRARTKRIE